MAYSVYYSDIKPPENTQVDVSKLIPFTFSTKESALEAAFKLIKNGAIVWEISLPDSSKISRSEIQKLYIEDLKR